MKEIQLTQGKVAIIDDEMYDRISCFTWYARKHGNTYYAGTNIRHKDGKQRTVRMHQLIMGYPDLRIDHVDNNGLNNLTCNLRLANQSQNSMNRKKTIGQSSQYKGVYWYKPLGKWKAQININGKAQVHLGYFDRDHEHMAAMAYDLQALEHFGEFAKTNLSIYNKL